VADARLEHLHAGLREAILYLALQVLGDVAGAASERQLALFVRIVRIARREVIVAHGTDDAPEDDDLDELDENEYEEHRKARHRAKLAFANHRILLMDTILIS
jgi:hypothetical protein